MPDLVFYEKPGCVGNARQKVLLKQHGCRLIVRNLLAEPWTAVRLRAFFGDKPVPEWFNDSAPGIKSGELQLEGLSAAAALALMVEEPLLIRRPLMQFGELRQSGFVDGPLLAAMGVRLQNDVDLQSCPREADSPPLCGEPS